MDRLTVIGAGLAGCEAAYQAASLGVPVKLCEMKPEARTPAHRSDGMAELVCSNSLRSAELTNASGLLKEELRRMDSVIMAACDATRVAAGGALAVDRELFSSYVTERIRSHPLIEIVTGEVTRVPREGTVVVATGPLTTDELAADIVSLVGEEGLSFFDAAAPIVSFDSIDMSRAFFASRYGKGSADYINCPMTEEEYRAFYNALISAEEAPVHGADSAAGIRVLEGCMPVEVMARRGFDTLRFGPLKPVGITNPANGETYYAVVQLRRENEAGEMFNLVGFQTHLKFPEQRRVFGMIPGLENADFLRYGVMHRNTFINSPEHLQRDYSLRTASGIYFAGQMTGVEGYIESAASGFVAGVSAALRIRGESGISFPDTTMIGAMAKYISEGGTGDFQPMNANFGIIAPLQVKVRGGKKARYSAYAERSLSVIDCVADELRMLRKCSSMTLNETKEESRK